MLIEHSNGTETVRLIGPDDLIEDKNKNKKMQEITEILFDEKSNMMYRKDTYDLEVIKEQKVYDELNLIKDSRVLDLGGNIGAFTCKAIDAGVRDVLVFEPEPDNFDLLCENIKLRGYELSSLGGHVSGHILKFVKIEDEISAEDEESDRELAANTIRERTVTAARQAVVGQFEIGDDGQEKKEMEFFLNVGINKGSHGLHIKRGRDRIVVGLAKFENVCKFFAPTVIKIDIEGSEYDLLCGFDGINKKMLPASCESVATELHFGKKEWREKLAPRFLEVLKNEGFRIVREPVVGEKNWHTVGVWRR